MADFPGEVVTKGIDAEPENGWADLRTRCKEYFEMGARFAKWRAVIKIDTGSESSKPSSHCLTNNATALANYALICQEQGLVPIIEPEVLMDGAHDANKCAEVTSEILRLTFEECSKIRSA